jgi:hypothetical protein
MRRDLRLLINQRRRERTQEGEGNLKVHVAVAVAVVVVWKQAPLSSATHQSASNGIEETFDA